MPHRVTLTRRQEELLRWIADGCPDGIMPDDSHRISVAALRNRGLATTSGRGASWCATITPAGIDYLEGLDAGPLRLPLAVRQALRGAGAQPPVTENGRFHPVARDFRDRIERHEVSRRQLQRATRLVQAIVTEAEARGWAVDSATESENEIGLIDWSSAKDGHIVVDAGDQRFWLRLQEEGVITRDPLEDDDETLYDRDGTGRLKLELRWGEWFTRQQTRWADRESAPLEDRLDAVFREIDERAEEARRQAAEKRARAERMAAAERAQALAREQEWTLHMARARERYFQAKRADALRAQTETWEEATRMRAYCDALAAARPDDQETAEWIAWARRFADQIDPTATRQRMPQVDEPAPGALQAFLPEGWSARGP
ncbi:MAG TPA: hypothetical protein VME01_01515 [Solirubrobacteraceae bacterium]|nr:hypothetical protein [Solirubrobacteraceae bacterium]